MDPDLVQPVPRARHTVYSPGNQEAPMPTTYHSSLYVPPSPGGKLPDLDRCGGGAVRRYQRFVIAAQQAGKRQRAYLSGLVAQPSFAKWQSFLVEERKATAARLTAARLKGATPEAMEKLAKAARAQALAAMKKLGIDPQWLAEAKRHGAAEMAKINRLALPAGRGKLRLADESWVHPLPDPPPPVATWYGPNEALPFTGWMWFEAWSRWYAAAPAYAGIVNLAGPSAVPITIDASIGEISAKNIIQYHAGYDDQFDQRTEASVGFWHRMQGTGPIRASIYATPLVTKHQVEWTDVTGPSHFYGWQSEWIQLEVIGPDGTSDGVDGSVRLYNHTWGASDGESNQPGTPGQIQAIVPGSTQSMGEDAFPRDGAVMVAEILSDRVYPSGKDVWVWAGVGSGNHVEADALYMDSRVEQRWCIRRVAVETA
jgi:hypothetical protein